MHGANTKKIYIYLLLIYALRKLHVLHLAFVLSRQTTVRVFWAILNPFKA